MDYGPLSSQGRKAGIHFDPARARYISYVCAWQIALVCATRDVVDPMNAASQRVKEVVRAVENGSLQQALDDLIDFVDEHSSIIPRAKRISSSAIRSSLAYHQQDVLRGTLTYEQITIARSRIVESILHLCDQLLGIFDDDTSGHDNTNAVSIPVSQVAHVHRCASTWYDYRSTKQVTTGLKRV